MSGLDWPLVPGDEVCVRTTPPGVRPERHERVEVVAVYPKMLDVRPSFGLFRTRYRIWRHRVTSAHLIGPRPDQEGRSQ